MSDPDRDEFYVGYLPQAPDGIASRVRSPVVLLMFFVAALAAVLVVSQRPFARSVFEFGVIRSLTGVIVEQPYPALLMQRPGATGTNAAQLSAYPLTIFGKFGAGAEVAGLDGRAVQLDGSLIYRDGRTMVQIEAGTVEPLPPAQGAALEGAARPADVELGTVTLVGEIVDSKCFYGVMKPGNLKPHRSCAARCISGGVPPVLLVRDREGQATYLLLVSSEGRAVNAEVLEFVAEPVEIRGRVVRRGDQLILHADPSGYRRL